MITDTPPSAVIIDTQENQSRCRLLGFRPHGGHLREDDHLRVLPARVHEERQVRTLCRGGNFFLPAPCLSGFLSAVAVPLLRRYMHYRGKYRHYIDNRHYSAYGHYWLFPYVPRDLTGVVAVNRHYSIGAIEGPLLHMCVASICFLTSYRCTVRISFPACVIQQSKVRDAALSLMCTPAVLM